jgi:hypothetical protein
MLHYVALYALYGSIRHYMAYGILWNSCIMLHYMALYGYGIISSIWHYMACDIIFHYVALCCIMVDYMALYGIIWHYMALYSKWHSMEFLRNVALCCII